MHTPHKHIHQITDLLVNILSYYDYLRGARTAILKLVRFFFLILGGKLFHRTGTQFSKDLFLLFVHGLGIAVCPFTADLVSYMRLFVKGINLSKRYFGPILFKQL